MVTIPLREVIPTCEELQSEVDSGEQEENYLYAHYPSQQQTHISPLPSNSFHSSARIEYDDDSPVQDENEALTDYQMAIASFDSLQVQMHPCYQQELDLESSPTAQKLSTVSEGI